MIWLSWARHSVNSIPSKLLTANNLCFLDYGPINLKIEAAQCATINGPSGCGKTRLLRSLADLDPHQGEIQLFDIRQTDISGSDWRRQIGFLGTGNAFWAETVRQHFLSVDTDTLDQYLQQLNLSNDILDQTIMRLSSGEKQRLALLRLLLGKPRALLLDEPTSHLDPDSTIAAESLVLDYQQKNLCPVIWVSHNKTQRERVASKHYSMENERLVEVTA